MGSYPLWTINLKSFEILQDLKLHKPDIMNYKLEKFWNPYSIVLIFNFISMNYKLEKFWNLKEPVKYTVLFLMNYKLEKFWNRFTNAELMNAVVWTINLKSFEILLHSWNI